MINFGAGKLIGIPTNLSDGSAVANPTPVLLGAMQEVSVDLSVDLKTLYGSQRYPIAVGQGKGKIEIKAKYADIDAGVLGSLFFGKAATNGIKGIETESKTIPGTPFQLTITPPNSGTFATDLGVYDAVTNFQYTRVASGPTTGQYAVNTGTGVYTFAAADTGKVLKVSYEYTAASTSGKIFNMTNETMGYTPSFAVLLQNQYDGKNLVMKLNRAVSGKLALPFKNEDFAIPDFEAEAFADAAQNIGYICLF